MNGRTVHLFVVIAYGKGVVMCEQFLGKYNGDSYSKFVHKYFPATFAIFYNSESKLILQNGDPEQNCKELHKAYNEIGFRIVPIPARPPDINSVENVFNNVRSKHRTGAWEQEIKYEPYEKFCEIVCSTLLNFSTEIIDRTIEAMPDRRILILAGKGHRTEH